jgi:hypothetical protein
MIKPVVSCRRIDHLRQLAYDCNLTDDEARKFGKLTKTSTWEALLSSHGLEFEPKPTEIEISPSNVAPANSIQVSPSIFLEWVDFGQLIAVTLASAGLSVLLLSLWPRLNPLNLLPQVKITIQLGANK